MSRRNRSIIIHLGSDHDDVIYAITKNAWEKYASKIDVDLLTTSNRHINRKHCKKSAIQESSLYDQSLVVSPNVIPTGLADNIFNYVPLGKWGLVDISGMCRKDEWHCHQRSLDKILNQNDLEEFYLNKVASTEVFIVPHHSEEMIKNEDCRQHFSLEEENVWFTYNIETTKQNVVWLNQLWCTCDTDQKFNDKYPYAKFINRSTDRLGVPKNLRSDIIQHRGMVNIPTYEPGDNAIVTIDFDDKFYGYTRDTIKKYSDKIGCQLIEITGAYSKNMHLCWPKYLVSEVAKDFNKTLYLDTDVYILKNAPNIFNEVPDNCWCVIDESSINKADHTVMDDEYNIMATKHNIQHKCKWHINNAGILVLPRNASEIYNNDEPWKLNNFSDEQTLLNYKLYGRKLFQLDTSWNTMPFTKSREPIKFYHIAGSNKLGKLAKYLNEEYLRILLKFTNNHRIIADRLTNKFIEIAHVGHYCLANKLSENRILKYYELVTNTNEFNPSLIIHIGTTPDTSDLEFDNIFIDIDIKNDQKDSASTYRFTDGEIDINISDYKPTKFGNRYLYLDTDTPTLTINYTDNPMYKNIVDEILKTEKYIVIILNDVDRNWKADYRFDDLDSYDDVLSKTDMFIDFEYKFHNHFLVHDCINSDIPVLCGYECPHTHNFDGIESIEIIENHITIN